MKNNLLYLSLSIFMCFNVLYGQENYGRIYATIGFGVIPLKNLNKALVSNGYDEVPGSNFTYGFGGNSSIGKLLIGGEGFYFSTSKVKKSQYEISTRGSLGYFYMGYHVVNGPKFYLAPNVGIGGGGKDVYIDSLVKTDLTDYLKNNYSKKLSTGNFIVHTGLRGGFPISDHFELDLDLGYNIGFNNDWNTSQGTLSNSVSDKIGGFYSTLNFVWRFKGKARGE